MIFLSLPYPPSMNNYWRNVNGRTLLSRKGRSYKREVKGLVLWHCAAKNLAGRLEVKITAHPPDRRQRDLDNIVKALLDSLQAAGVFLDDSQVDKLTVERGEVEKGGIVAVTIREL